VIEVDPELKKELYQRLECENSNLKAWFLSQVEAYLVTNNQLPLELDCEIASSGKNEKL
jgi:hypothetical protein